MAHLIHPLLVHSLRKAERLLVDCWWFGSLESPTVCSSEGLTIVEMIYVDPLDAVAVSDIMLLGALKAERDVGAKEIKVDEDTGAVTSFESLAVEAVVGEDIILVDAFERVTDRDSTGSFDEVAAGDIVLFCTIEVLCDSERTFGDAIVMFASSLEAETGGDMALSTTAEALDLLDDERFNNGDKILVSPIGTLSDGDTTRVCSLDTLNDEGTFVCLID